MNCRPFRNWCGEAIILLAGALAAPSFCHGAGLSLDFGYRQMYNLEFQAAHETFHNWERQNPADPWGPASDAAAYLFFEFDRLHILQSDFFSDDSNFDRSRQ